MVLPGSAWQIPLVKKCKEQGYRTLVVNPFDNSPAFSFADEYLQRDIFAIDDIVEYCRSQNIKAVISDECDIAMPIIAELGERLSLSTIDKESSFLYTNKFAMREFCSKHGLLTPEYRLCKNVEEAEEFYDQIKSKIIMKPLDSNSSRGVFTISRKKDIKNFFSKSIKFSRIQDAVLVERFIEGTEFTIDGIKTPLKHYSLAISEKKAFSHNKNIASELYFIQESNRFDYDLLKKQNDEFINNSNLKFGLTHAEYKFDGKNYYLIEIAARGGGNLISSHIVPYLSGVDNYDYLINCYLGKIPDLVMPATNKYRNRCAVLKFFDIPKDCGIVKEITGLNMLKNYDNIVEYKFNFSVGDILKKATSDAERAGFYIACCETKEELDFLIEEIHQKVRIICE